jgi:hypothetical protein
MAEDWRVTATLHGDVPAGRLLQALHLRQVEDDVRERLGHRVAVSGGNSHVFLYADTGEAASEAEGVVREVIAEHDLTADVALDRWHPLEEEWEDAKIAMPQTAEERKAEHQRLETEETEESQATGVAEWEVRVELRSHRDAVELAERLKGEGDSLVRRWKFLLVGANNEDDANELARKIKQEAPAGAVVHVEPGGGMVWQMMPATPFAVFGGLGG